jgi:hypothetical protein
MAYFLIGLLSMQESGWEPLHSVYAIGTGAGKIEQEGLTGQNIATRLCNFNGLTTLSIYTKEAP